MRKNPTSARISSRACFQSSVNRRALSLYWRNFLDPNLFSNNFRFARDSFAILKLSHSSRMALTALSEVG